MRMFATEVVLFGSTCGLSGPKLMPSFLAVDWLFMDGRHGAIRQATKGVLGNAGRGGRRP